MKKNRTGTKKFPALILFLLGFLAGNLIPNIIWKAKWQQKTWASVYFLSTFAGKNTGNIEYLKEILKYRGVFYLLNIICGFSVFGAPLANPNSSIETVIIIPAYNPDPRSVITASGAPKTENPQIIFNR